jgi:hypothetical protein
LEEVMATREKATRQVLQHVARARQALDDFHNDGVSAEGVLMRSHFQSAVLKVAREELQQAIAIIERTKWGAQGRE